MVNSNRTVTQVDYYIVTGCPIRDVIEEVKKLQKMGWEVIGGITYGETNFFQAMVKYAVKEESEV